MNEDQAIIKTGKELIQKDLLLDEDAMALSTYSKEELLQALTQVVSYLLDKDMERLMNSLYRIDVDETRVKQAFAVSEPDKLAGDIAKLIIERELKKAHYRSNYQSNL